LSPALQRACTWAGPAFVAVFFGGIMCAGWLPPLSANMTADEVARLYVEDGDRIAVGAILIGTAGMFQGIWAAVMSTQMRRIEGDRPVMTYAQLAAGGVGILVVVLPFVFFSLAAYRPERNPEITQAFHDIGWISLVGVGWPAILQALAVGIATLSDRGTRPVFPRWFGYFNLWMAFAFVPGPLLVLFETGPFAWHGFAVFWIPAAVFGLWFGAWFVVLRRAIAEEGS